MWVANDFASPIIPSSSQGVLKLYSRDEIRVETAPFALSFYTVAIITDCLGKKKNKQT